MELQQKEATYKLEIQAQIARQQEAEELAKKQAEKDMQPMLDAINEATINRVNANHAATLQREAAELAQKEAHEASLAEIEAAKQAAYAETVKQIMGSITPDLIAALETGGKCDLMAALAEHMSPYAIANGEGVVETTDRLLRGMPIDSSLQEILGGLKSDN
jgi:superfamily II DNA/RNA helicase